MTQIQENLSRVLDSIRAAEKKAGRPEHSVKLLAVSKFHPAESVVEAVRAGQCAFGENRVQEAVSKFPAIYEEFPNVELHIIGTLQTNKVRKAVQVASVIESVDSLKLLCEIEKQAAKLDKTVSVFFEYHTGEESKSGFLSFEELREAVQFCAEGNAPHVVPRGFMTMAPFTDDKALIRASFATLRDCAERLRAEFPSLPLTELSMGMSGDFELAIAEGSTEVRVGTAIFGERNYSVEAKHEN